MLRQIHLNFACRIPASPRPSNLVGASSNRPPIQSNLVTDKTMDSVVDLKTMNSGVHPKMMDFYPYENMNGLDPRRMMDFVLFGNLCYDFILPSVTFEYMKSCVKLIEGEDFQELPPLDVIFYGDLVSTSWGWDRLMPWRIGFLLFEDYFGYLEQYYRVNENKVFQLHGLSFNNGSASLNAAAAKECIKAEEQLIAKIAGHDVLTQIVQHHKKLSQKIVEQALTYDIPDSASTIPAGSIIPATCFMCIKQEARLKMLEMSDMDADDVELWRMKFEFGSMVRQVALDILIKYRGPHSEQVSAAMLGMANEYSYACELLEKDLKQGVEYCDELSESSQEIRHLLLELLFIILNNFPSQSAIDYDSVRDFRIARGNKHIKHLSAPRKEIASASEVSPANFVETAVPETPTPLPCCQEMGLESLCENSTDITDAIFPKTPTPTKIASPATPSSFARSVSNYPSDQSSANYKKRSIGVTQVSDSELPSTQPSEQSNDSVTAEFPTFAYTTSGYLPIGGLSDDESNGENVRNTKKSKNTMDIQGTDS